MRSQSLMEGLRFLLVLRSLFHSTSKKESKRKNSKMYFFISNMSVRTSFTPSKEEISKEVTKKCVSSLSHRS